MYIWNKRLRDFMKITTRACAGIIINAKRRPTLYLFSSTLTYLKRCAQQHSSIRLSISDKIFCPSVLGLAGFLEACGRIKGKCEK